jgi:hypothetical protein
MAKQTFTTGQVLTAAQMTSLQQTAMLGGAANAKVASYVLVAADAGDAITMSNASPTTITVNTGLFATGDIVTIINLGAGATTITAGTATVATSGSLVLATNQGGVLRFTSASAAIFFQFATPASGDIEGVTAGTGISGGGTSGTVTVTNSMATAIDAKGDLIVGTGADTFSRLAVGTNTYTLVADSSESTGLKWQAPASGGGMTLLSTTDLTGGETVTISSINQSYTDLQIEIFNVNMGAVVNFMAIEPNSTNNITANQYVANNTSGTDFRSRLHLVRTANLRDSSTTNAWTVRIANYASTTGRKPFSVEGAWYSGSIDVWNAIINGGIIDTTSAITALKFSNQSGDFAAGKVLIYGVK